MTYIVSFWFCVGFGFLRNWNI